MHVTADRLAVARRDVNDLDSRWVVSLLRSRLEEFAAKLDSVDADAQLAAVAVDDIPTLLGAGGERRQGLSVPRMPQHDPRGRPACGCVAPHPTDRRYQRAGLSTALPRQLLATEEMR